MLHIDTGQVTFTTATGEFFCPTCNSKQACRLRTVRRFLRLYFIPLIPLEEVSRHVQCLKCRKDHDIRWLHQKAAAQQPQLEPAQIGAVVLAAMRFVFDLGESTAAHLAALAEIAEQLTGNEVTGADILDGRRWLARQGVTAADYLADAQLMPRELDLAIQLIFRAASAGGDLTAAQTAELAALCDRLRINTDRFRHLIIREVRASGQAASGQGVHVA